MGERLDATLASQPEFLAYLAKTDSILFSQGVACPRSINTSGYKIPLFQKEAGLYGAFPPNSCELWSLSEFSLGGPFL